VVRRDERRNKPIALADNCFYELRVVRVVAQSLADLANSGIDAALCVQKYIVTPKPGNHLLAGNKFAGMFKKKKQKLQRDMFEFERAATVPQLIALSIRLKAGKRKTISK